jgi:hypothetical protein
MDWLFRLITRLWAVNDPLPANAGVIVIVSYGVRKSGHLTNGSLLAVNKAKELQKLYPRAKILWGVFSKSENYLQEIEWKRHLLSGRGWYIGKVSSSIDECMAAQKLIREIGLDKSSMIVVPDENHSRRDKFVWSYFFSDSLLSFQSVSAVESADPESPMIAQSNSKVWLSANMVGLIIYKIVGIEIMARINPSQPTK